ncbi:MAG: HzsA-related protein [Planctomycetota bacterium]|jgi:hypothetical protein
MLRTGDLPPASRPSLRAALILAALTTTVLTPGAGPAEQSNEGPALPAGHLVFTQVPVGAGLDLPAGSRIVSFDPSRPQEGVTELTGGFSAAGRPDVSFDGRRLLFVGRRSPDEPLAVWEMNVDGSGLRRITDQAAGIRGAIYLSTIYTIDDHEPADQIAFCADDPGGAVSLYTCRTDGTRLSRITFDPYGATDPCQLSDGRLLFSGGPGSALLTVNTDGTDVFVFAAADEPPAWRGMPCETDDGSVVFVESPNDDGDRAGALVAVSRTSSLHSRRVLAGDPSGSYRSPAAAGANLLVSYRAHHSASYGLCVLDPKSGTRTAGVYDAPQWHELDAVVVRARTGIAGRSSVVNERVSHGVLYCLDAYLTGTQRSRGDGDERIDRLEVYRAMSSSSRDLHDPAAGAVGQELLGTVPVEPDGSFHLNVPVRTPLRLETLGPDGQVLQAMRSWFWVMPGERRGCIGCHEDRELSPPNRHPLALRREPHLVGVSGDAAGKTE